MPKIKYKMHLNSFKFNFYIYIDIIGYYTFVHYILHA